MLDPRQKFIIEVVDRETIADRLNDALQDVWQTDDEEFAAGDDRLTDELCQEFADGFAAIDRFDSEDCQIHNECAVVWDLLSKFGFDELSPFCGEDSD